MFMLFFKRGYLENSIIYRSEICMIDLHIHPEGSVSQNFDLDSSFNLCDLENNVLKMSKKLPEFGHEMTTKPK